MIDIQVAIDKLNGFEELDDLVGFLRKEGVVGLPREAEFCPISNWLRRTTGYYAATWTDVIECWQGDYDDTERFEFERTPILDLFIWGFDEGCYPDLEAEGS